MKIRIFLLTLITYFPLWGMLYPEKKYDSSPKIFLVPYPTSVLSLEEWKKQQKGDYEKISLDRNIAEKSAYIKNAHQAAIGRMGVAYSSTGQHRLKIKEEIFVKTDYPEGLKALVKLYTQEEIKNRLKDYESKTSIFVQGKDAAERTIKILELKKESGKLDLSGKELISLILSDLIKYLDMPQPQMDPAELLSEKMKNNPHEYVGFSDDIEFEDETTRILMRHIIKNHSISRFIIQYVTFLKNKKSDIKNPHHLLFKQEGIKKEDLLFFDKDENIKIYGTVLLKSPNFYEALVIVDKDNNRKKILFDAQGDITVIPHKNKRFYIIKTETQDEKSFYLMDSQSSEHPLYLDNMQACCFVDDDIVYGINKDSFVEHNLKTHEEAVCKLPKEMAYNIENKNIIDLLSIGNERDGSSVFLYVTNKLMHKFLWHKGNVFSSSVIKQDSYEISSVSLNQSKSKILVQISQGKSLLGNDYSYYFELYNLVDGTPIFDYQTPEKTISVKLDAKVSSFLGKDNLMIAYIQSFQFNKVSLALIVPYLDMKSIRLDSGPSHGRVIPALDRKNLIFDTASDYGASYFSVYDDTLLELLDYFNPAKEFKDFSYTQRLEGILCLCSLFVRIGHAAVDFKEKESKIVETCFPQSIQDMIAKIMGGRQSTTQPIPQSVTPEPISAARVSIQQQQPVIAPVSSVSNADGNYWRFPGNYIATMYNTLRENISQYKQTLLFGTKLGAAAAMAALYKYMKK